MKQDKNNEMDLLLRSLARGRGGESSLDVGQASTSGKGVSNHLDADELSCFAEGVLPAPARERYIAHLADCESCRGVVVNLMQASGAAVRSEPLEQKSGAGFWHKIGALFSPPVLRYAVPVVALTAVIAISFLAFRQQRGSDLVARNEPIISSAPAVTNEQQPGSALPQSSLETTTKLRSGAESPAQADSDRFKSASKDERTSVPQGSATIAGASVPTPSPLKDSMQSKQGYTVDGSRPVFAPEPQAAPAPPPKAALNEVDKAAAVQKEEVSRREVQALPREEEKNQPRDDAGRHGPARSNTTLSGSKRAEGLMTESRDSVSKSKKDSDDEVETRTVSGRRFRRQGSLWIDTAYDSSRGTITLSRGSEQFRALVADEPGIRTIAEKLDGVVIVVWKGRAYRIQ